MHALDERSTRQSVPHRTPHLPDASVFCDPMTYDDEDPYRETAINPTALFEVLSKSTEAYDRGIKSTQYRLISSLKVHVLVSQEEPHVELYERQDDSSWRFTEVSGKQASLLIASLGIRLSLAELYDRVEFEEAGLR